MRVIAIDVLVGMAVLVTLLSVLGMMRMRDPYQKMHYISAPASLSGIFITIAIFLQQGLKPESFKAGFLTVVLIGMNTVVTHAAARALRIAQRKSWVPREDEEVPIRRTDEFVTQERRDEAA